MTPTQIGNIMDDRYNDPYSPTNELAKITFNNGVSIIGYFYYIKESDELKIHNKYTFITERNHKTFKETKDHALIETIDGNNIINIEYPIDFNPVSKIFIESININNIRNIEPRFIKFQEDKKHLIITGKNGIGKTTFLSEIKKFLNQIPSGGVNNYDNLIRTIESLMATKKSYLLNRENMDEDVFDNQLIQLDNQISSQKNVLEKFGGTKLTFNKTALHIQKKFKEGKFIIAYFDAQRNKQFNHVEAVSKLDKNIIYDPNHFAGARFLEFLVNLKAEKSFANDDNDNQTVERIENWFKIFKNEVLSLITNDNSKIDLKFDRKSFSFLIHEHNKEPYSFNQLSSGYSALFNIVAELIMRNPSIASEKNNIEGVVLIDEIEIHLHVDLQKRILPFLTKFFPNIQFIVTTHSPFILNSVNNAVICDFEKNIITDDLSGYSYETLIESYFGTDQYSNILKEKLNKLEIIISEMKTFDDTNLELNHLLQYFDQIPKFVSDELTVRLQQLKLRLIDLKHKK